MSQQGQQGVSITAQNGVYSIAGTIDEYADFSALMSVDPEMRLNLAGVKRINSIGLRNFMMFLKGWGKGKYSFIDCPVEFVDQVNLIPSILKIGGQGSIESCQTPVVCKSCGRDGEIKVKLPQGSNKTQPALKGKCPSCGGEFELASETYFHFLQFLR